MGRQSGRGGSGTTDDADVATSSHELCTAGVNRGRLRRLRRLHTADVGTSQLTEWLVWLSSAHCQKPLCSSSRHLTMLFSQQTTGWEAGYQSSPVMTSEQQTTREEEARKVEEVPYTVEKTEEQLHVQVRPSDLKDFDYDLAESHVGEVSSDGVNDFVLEAPAPESKKTEPGKNQVTTKSGSRGEGGRGEVGVSWGVSTTFGDVRRTQLSYPRQRTRVSRVTSDQSPSLCLELSREAGSRVVGETVAQLQSLVVIQAEVVHRAQPSQSLPLLYLYPRNEVTVCCEVRAVSFVMSPNCL